MAAAPSTEWRTVWRAVASMGLAVGAWLLVIPTASSEGTSCGVPVVNTDPAETGDFAIDCADRNGVRVTQGMWTLALASAWIIVSVTRPWLALLDEAGDDSSSDGKLKQAARTLRSAADSGSAPTTRIEHATNADQP